MNKEAKIERLGRVGGGKSQSKTVYSTEGIAPTICGTMEKGNVMPYIVVESMIIEEQDEREFERK